MDHLATLMVPELLRIQSAEGPSEGCFDLHGLEVWRVGLPGYWVWATSFQYLEETIWSLGFCQQCKVVH